MKKILLSLAVLALSSITAFSATYTTNLNLKKPAHGEDIGTWDQAINNNMDIIDANVAILPVDLGSEVTGVLGSQHMVSTAVFTTIQNTFTDKNNFQTITGTSVSITGPLNISTLPANQCVQTGTGGLLTVTGSACGGGGASPSTLETLFGTSRSSPTATLKGQTGQFTGSVSGSTMTFALDSSSVTLQGQNVIKLSNTLQANSTFYVSSGTVAGQLSANKVIASTLSVTGDATIDALRVTGSGGLKVDTLTSGQCVQAGTGGLLTVTGAACGTGSGGGVVVPSTFTWGTVTLSTATASYISVSRNNIGDYNSIASVSSSVNLVPSSHIRGFSSSITGSTHTAEVIGNFAHASGTSTVSSAGMYGYSSAYGPVGYGGYFGAENATTNYGIYVSTGLTRLASLDSKSCLGTDSNGVVIEGNCPSIYPSTATPTFPYGANLDSSTYFSQGSSITTSGTRPQYFHNPDGGSWLFTGGLDDLGDPRSLEINQSGITFKNTVIGPYGFTLNANGNTIGINTHSSYDASDLSHPYIVGPITLGGSGVTVDTTGRINSGSMRSIYAKLAVPNALIGSGYAVNGAMPDNGLRVMGEAIVHSSFTVVNGTVSINGVTYKYPSSLPGSTLCQQVDTSGNVTFGACGSGGGGGYALEPSTVTPNLAKGFTASTGTITGADGLSVTYGVTAGSLTINGAGNPSFVKNGESIAYQIVGTSVVPTAGQCAVFTSSMSVQGITCGSGSGNVTVLGTPTNGQMARWTSATSISSATASDIVGTFTGCSGTQYLGADGACHTASGSPDGSAWTVQVSSGGVFGGFDNLTNNGSTVTISGVYTRTETNISTDSYSGVYLDYNTSSMTITGLTVVNQISAPNVPQFYTLTADSTTTGTGAAATPITFPVLANTTYYIDCFLIFQTTTTTTGIAFALNTPATPGYVNYTAGIPTAADGTGGALQGWGTASEDYVTGTGVQAAMTSYVARLYGVFANGANAGNLTVKYKSELASQNGTLKAGSMCQLLTNPGKR